MNQDLLHLTAGAPASRRKRSGIQGLPLWQSDCSPRPPPQSVTLSHKGFHPLSQGERQPPSQLGGPVWQALSGHKRRIPLAVVLSPPARGAGTLIPSAQRLVWAAKQPLGNAALGALFAEGQTRLSDFTFTFHFHALEKEMVKAQHEGALPPPCIVRKDPRVPHTARRGA